MNIRVVIAQTIFEKKYQKLKFRFAFLLYFVILVLGSLPGARAEVGQFAPGFILHALAYSFITFLIFAGTNGPKWRRGVAALWAIMVMGAADEWVQSFFPYRSSKIEDWYVDVGAALVTLVILWVISPQKGQREATSQISNQ